MISRNDNANKDIQEALKIDPNDVDALEAQGDYHTRQNQYRLAIGCYTKAIKLAPERAHLYESRAYLYTGLNQNELAIADCKRALELDEDSAYASNLLDSLSGHDLSK